MRFASALVGVVAASLVFTGCTASTAESGLDKGASVTIATNDAFDSGNPATTFGNTGANTSVGSLTNDWFSSVDDTPKLVHDTDFGESTVVSTNPLTVTYTVRQGVKWSDGTAVDAADLMLDWAANSRALDTDGYTPDLPADAQRQGLNGDLPEDVVYFDSGAQPDSGLGLVHDIPTVSDDGRSITMVYSAPYADWELVFPRALPAHVVGENALGAADAASAKTAVLDAITQRDVGALSELASFWNSGFNFTELPGNSDLLVGTGPYTVTGITAGESVTLTANPEYTGSRKPSIETIVFRFIADPLTAVQALRNGEVDVISTPAIPAVMSSLDGVDGTEVITGSEGTYEHIDLQTSQSKSGVFDDPRVREAFLKVVPRQEMLDELVTPIVGAGAFLRNSQVLVPGAEGYADATAQNGSEQLTEVDVPGARDLLAQAGVSAPEVCILYESGNPRRVQEFEMIQASAAQAGFAVTDCGDPDWRELLGASNNYDAALFGWSTPSLAVSAASATFTTAGANNYSFFSNAEVDAVAARLGMETDPQTQVALQQQLDGLLFDNFYGLPLFDLPTVTAHSSRIEGISPSIIAPHLAWNLPDWTVVPAD